MGLFFPIGFFKGKTLLPMAWSTDPSTPRGRCGDSGHRTHGVHLRSGLRTRGEAGVALGDSAIGMLGGCLGVILFQEF